jgi:hypothetical protein
MVVSVPLALLGARGANLSARRNLRPRSLGDVFGLPGEDVARGIADIGAVQAEPHAAAHLGNVVLRQVCIGTRRTALRTGKALIDAPG